jgi:hypothetical protein
MLIVSCQEMLMRGAGLLIAVVLLIVAPVWAQEDIIEIKGLQIGMTKEEVKAKIGTLAARDFTIAGVPNKYPFFEPQFYSDKLDHFVFFFDSKFFNQMLEAVRAKYPALRCEESMVSTGAGGSFTQVKCTLRDSIGVLSLSRFVNDINTSGLSVYSHRFLNEEFKSREQRQKDL